MGWDDRFWSKVSEAEDGCWTWTGRLQHGYGTFAGGPRSARSHRVAYELVVGLIPDGLVIDHLCRNKACVNPAHLEAVTQRENVLRGEGTRKEFCVNGHRIADDEYVPPGSGKRVCRQCKRLYLRQYKARRRAREGEVAA